MNSVSRASCDLQVLDSAIVERIEEAVEKAKVTHTASNYRHQYQRFSLYV